MKQLILFCLLCLVQKMAFGQTEKIVLSDKLELVKLSANTWQHVSYEEHPRFGKFTSNGVLYLNRNEALILDTPPDEALSELLLRWLKKKHPQVKVKAVIVNHFHHDCLGGLAVFHRAGIPSYSHRLTPGLAIADTAAVPVTPPQHVFSDNLKLEMGGATAEARYFGEAHTRDNIVVWLPEEKVLFGGCMVKSLGSGKGNLADANVAEWAATVQRVKKAYPKAEMVVPGHGAPGNTELLDYTIRMFSEEPKRK